MARVQLLELEDQPWFPGLLRQCMQEYLEFMGNLSPLPFERFSARLAQAMRATGETHLVDLCSGGAGPVPTIVRLLRAQGVEATAQLSDLYPNVEALEAACRRAGAGLGYVATSVDAANVPATLKGFRLLCNSFHHLPPPVARQVLQDAVQQRRGIAIVEVVGRNVPAFLNVLLSPLLALFFTPWVRPFRVSRLLLTYLIPLLPLCTLFDGLVSCLRVYAPEELRALTRDIPARDYIWDVGQLAVGRTPAVVTYLIGHPTPRQ